MEYEMEDFIERPVVNGVDGTVCNPFVKLLEEFFDENEPWLLIGIPRRDHSL